MRTDSPPRIAFAIAGDATDPAAYSGAPASLLRGFVETGFHVTPVSTDFSPAAQRLLVNVLALGFIDPLAIATHARSLRTLRLAVRESKPKLLPSRELTHIRTMTIARRLAASGPFDRTIQFGSEYRLPAGTDYVTLDDATILQLWRSYPYDWMTKVHESSLRRMIARQRSIFREARACCLLNRWAAESVVADYGVPSERVHVVGTGSNRTIEVADRAWDPPRFLLVAKDFVRKNGPTVLRAFAEVRRAAPAATLDVVGGHPPLDQDGVTGHGLLRLDSASGTEALNRLYASATCLVLPSLLEPTGNVHAEALSAGIGSIGTRAGGVDTIIGDAGVTVSPFDVEELVAAMLLFCDSARAAEFGRRATARAPLFTWHAVAERVMRAMALPGTETDDLADFL